MTTTTNNTANNVTTAATKEAAAYCNRINRAINKAGKDTQKGFVNAVQEEKKGLKATLQALQSMAQRDAQKVVYVDASMTIGEGAILRKTGEEAAKENTKIAQAKKALDFLGIDTNTQLTAKFVREEIAPKIFAAAPVVIEADGKRQTAEFTKLPGTLKKYLSTFETYRIVITTNWEAAIYAAMYNTTGTQKVVECATEAPTAIKGYLNTKGGGNIYDKEGRKLGEEATARIFKIWENVVIARNAGNLEGREVAEKEEGRRYAELETFDEEQERRAKQAAAERERIRKEEERKAAKEKAIEEAAKEANPKRTAKKEAKTA